MKKQRLLFAACALAGGLMALLTGWLLVFRPLLVRARPEPLRAVENVRVVRQEIAQAFGKKGGDANKDEAESLRVFFDRLGTAFGGANPPAIADYFDTRRMVKEFRRAGLWPGMTDRQEAELHAGLIRGAAQGFGGQALSWDRTEIRSVKFLDDPDEAIVIARHRKAGLVQKMRWWVRRDAGRWRVYDFEDLDVSFRVSSAVASLVPAGGRPPDWIRSVGWLKSATQAMLVGDLDKVERTLEEVRDIKFPAQIEGLRWLILGSVKIQRQRLDEAVACLDKARGFNKDMPCLDVLYGVAYNGLGQPEKALTHLRTYQELMGDDGDTSHHIGVALARLGKREEAVVAFRKALDEEPNSSGSLMELAKLLPVGKKAELADRFARLTNPEMDFELLAGEAFTASDVETVELYVNAMRRRKSTAPVVDYCLARVRAQQGRVEESVPLFKNAIARIDEGPVRKDYVAAYLRDVATAGKPLEGYRAAADARAAFAVLAQELLNRRKLASLRELVDAHRQRDRDDVWLYFYQGEVHLDARAFGKAEEKFAAGMARPLDDAARERFREARVYARFSQGKGLSAYEELGPRRATFAQLAGLYAQGNDGKQLAALVDAHRRADGTDPSLPLWDAEAKWLSRDYEATVRLLQEHRNGVFADQAHKPKFWYRLLCSLSRLKRTQEVRKEAETLAGNVAAGGKDVGLLLGDLARERQTEAMEVLADALAKAAPGDPDGAFYQARAKVLRGRLDEAGALLRAALDRQQDPQKRRQYADAFVLDALDSGKAIEGYRAAPDPDAAFRLMADELISTIYDFGGGGDFPNDIPGRKPLGAKGTRDTLRGLIAAHREKRPADPLVDLFTGELCLLESDYAGAEEALKAGMARPLDDNLRRRFVSLRVQARYKAGKGLSAYEDLGRGKEVFNQLANLYTFAKDFKGLEALIAAHRRAEPADRTLPVWETEVKWLAGDYAATVKLLRAHRAGAFADQNHQWKYRDRLVRSLARLKRFDEALKEAEAGTREKFGNPMLVAVVHALAGDVAKAGAALEECKNRYGGGYAFYGDPDLGPVLRSEPFRELRERYPEPKRFNPPGQ